MIKKKSKKKSKKKYTYTIDKTRVGSYSVFENVLDADTGVILGFWGVYRANTRKECEAWLKGFKKGLKMNDKGRTNRNNN